MTGNRETDGADIDSDGELRNVEVSTPSKTGSGDQKVPSQNVSDVAPLKSEVPESIDLERSTVGEAASSLIRIFNYSASIPERTLRSATALAGGFVHETANWLIPTAFRNSKSYSIFVQQMLDFVVNDVGWVRRPAKEERPREEIDLARKTVGNLLDMTAFATFHVSPITVLAIFSDVAYGSKVYLEQLSDRLKEQEIISQDTTIDHAADLIEALENASGNAVGMFDQPPISIEGLKKTIVDTQRVVSEIDPASLFPAAEIDQLWKQMELAAEDQSASLWDVSATISMVALNHIHSAGKGAIASLEIAGDLFGEHIITHYWEGLREIERDGLLPTLSNASQPYLEAVWSNFSINQKSWTEQLLSGDFFKWGWNQLSWPRPTRETEKDSPQ